MSSPSCRQIGGSSLPSASRAYNNSLKSTNSPAAAAEANLWGIAGMEPLMGATTGRGGAREEDGGASREFRED